MSTRAPTYSASYASAPQLATLLRGIVDGDSAAYRLDCPTAKAAHALRSRLNKVRAMDRASMAKVYADEGIVPDMAQGLSLFDSLVFRVEGPSVIVVKGGIPEADLLSLLIPCDTPEADREAPSDLPELAEPESEEAIALRTGTQVITLL